MLPQGQKKLFRTRHSSKLEKTGGGRAKVLGKKPEENVGEIKLEES